MILPPPTGNYSSSSSSEEEAAPAPKPVPRKTKLVAQKSKSNNRKRDRPFLRVKHDGTILHVNTASADHYNTQSNHNKKENGKKIGGAGVEKPTGSSTPSVSAQLFIGKKITDVLAFPPVASSTASSSNVVARGRGKKVTNAVRAPSKPSARLPAPGATKTKTTGVKQAAAAAATASTKRLDDDDSDDESVGGKKPKASSKPSKTTGVGGPSSKGKSSQARPSSSLPEFDVVDTDDTAENDRDDEDSDRVLEEKRAAGTKRFQSSVVSPRNKGKKRKKIPNVPKTSSSRPTKTPKKKEKPSASSARDSPVWSLGSDASSHGGGGETKVPTTKKPKAKPKPKQPKKAAAAKKSRKIPTKKTKEEVDQPPNLESANFKMQWLKVGDPVFAEFTDGGEESFYFGLITEVNDEGGRRYTVTFDDGDVQENLDASKIQRLEEFVFFERLSWIDDDIHPPFDYVELLDKPCSLAHMREKACGLCNFCLSPPCEKCDSCRSRGNKAGCLQNVCLKFPAKARMQDAPCIPGRFKYYFDVAWKGKRKDKLESFLVLVDCVTGMETTGFRPIMQELSDDVTATKLCDFLGFDAKY